MITLGVGGCGGGGEIGSSRGYTFFSARKIVNLISFNLANLM